MELNLRVQMKHNDNQADRFVPQSLQNFPFPIQYSHHEYVSISRSRSREVPNFPANYVLQNLFNGWLIRWDMADCVDGYHVPGDMEVDSDGDVISVCTKCGVTIAHTLMESNWFEY